MITLTWFVLIILLIAGLSACVVINKIANFCDKLDEILEDWDLTVEAVREE